MSGDFLFSTGRFNLSVVHPHFINPCCFGEDLAAWLGDRLRSRGISATAPGQEDWGWYIGAEHGGQSYFIGVGGNPDEDGGTSDRGEWRVMIERHRTLWQKITGENRMTDDDEVRRMIGDILRGERDFSAVCVEGDGD